MSRCRGFSLSTRPWDELKRAADHQRENVEDLWRENRLSEADLAVDPLAASD